MVELQKPETVVVLMRHGERIDLTFFDRFKQDWSSQDPIITPDGCQMAFETG